MAACHIKLKQQGKIGRNELTTKGHAEKDKAQLKACECLFQIQCRTQLGHVQNKSKLTQGKFN